jgi:hypothetical protein
MKKSNNTHILLGLYHVTVGGEEGLLQNDPLFRLTSDGTMLSELLSTLETGDPNAAGDPNAPLFSEDTINAILGEQLRETAAQVAHELGQQQQNNYQQQLASTAVQQQPTAMDLQTVLSGHSTSSMMSLQEVTAAMQTHHHTLPHSSSGPAATATVAMTMPISTVHLQHQQQQGQQHGQQKYLTLLDGKILHQADGSAVLASVPSGQQPLAVTLPGSTSVLQYIPVLNSQVVSVPHIQVQPSAAQQQQQQMAVAAMAAAATLSGGAGGGLSDGSGAVLPTTAGTTPLATTPTSAAAAANAGVYTSEISTTQQLVATAAAQQQWLQQEAANAASAATNGGVPIGATDAANVAMREATAAVADMAHPQNNNNMTTSGGGQVSPRTMAMPPPPPRAPRRSMETSTTATMPLQPPSLTPQLRPATTEPFPSLTAAVLAAQGGGHQRQQHQEGELQFQQVQPLLRPAVTAASLDIPLDGQLPRKPSHKRERSLRSANPITADPTTAPTIKYAKGHNNDDGDTSSGGGSGSGLGTSPDSCILATAVAVSTGGSSGDVSPLNGVYTQLNSMPEPPLSPLQRHQMASQQQQQQHQMVHHQPSASAPESTTTKGDDNNDNGNGHAAAAGEFEVDEDVMALMQAALAPKAGKRRGRPPGSTKTASVPSVAVEVPHEPTDAEILESLLREDPSRRQLPVDEIKKLVRKEKNRIAAAISRTRTANYTAALESRVKALQAEQAELSGWLQAPPNALPHRVLLVGPAAAAAAGAVAGAAEGRPPIRHLSL